MFLALRVFENLLPYPDSTQVALLTQLLTLVTFAKEHVRQISEFENPHEQT